MIRNGYFEALETMAKIGERMAEHGIEVNLSTGVSCAYRVYKRAIRLDDDILEMNSFLWNSQQIEDFLNTLKAADINEFILTDKSTALMENIHFYVEAGCTMEGLVKFNRTDDWGDVETIRGIKFRIF